MNTDINKKRLAVLASVPLVVALGVSGCGAKNNTDLSSIKPVSKNDVNIKFTQFYDNDNFLNLNITEGVDAVKDVRFLFFYEMGDNPDAEAEEFLYLGEDNDLEGDYDTGKFKDNFNGYWASIGNEIVTTEIIETTDNYTLYSVPCIIDGKESSIRAMYDYTSNSYKILGRYDGLNKNSGSQMTSRGVRKIDNGSQVIFTLTAVKNKTFEEYEYQTDPITWSDSTVMESTDLGDGKFLYMYEIEDVFGTEIDADPVEVEVNGENVTWLTEL